MATVNTKGVLSWRITLSALQSGQQTVIEVISMKSTNFTFCKTTAAVAISCLLLFNQAQGIPIQWNSGIGANNHYYDVIGSTGITWIDAKIQAEAMGGYLATITSSQENAFVYTFASNPVYWFSGYPNGVGPWQGPWLGGFQPTGSPEPNGGWQWLNGEGAFAFTAWAPSEPSNGDGNEDRLIYYGRNDSIQPTWNDLPVEPIIGSRPLGYVVEWNTSPNIPEPSGLLLMLAGFVGMFISQCHTYIKH